MFNDPNVGEIITINGKKFEFTQAPGISEKILYAELGKKAKVYRVKQGSKIYALKAFKKKYRRSRTIANSNKINDYQNLAGLAVAEREIITPEKFPDLVSQYEAFSYAILMPWIEGKSWANYVAERRAITKAESITLANALIKTLHELEKQNLAHCDLSGGNFIFSPDFTSVELLDIEELYSKEFKEPKPLPRGTAGYAPQWLVEKGLWDSTADRFAAGILICEILGWQFEEVREAANKGDAYFSSSEIGEETERYKLFLQKLEQLEPSIPDLLQKLWYSKSPQECPSLSNWKAALEQIPEQPAVLNWQWESLNIPSEVIPFEKEETNKKETQPYKTPAPPVKRTPAQPRKRSQQPEKEIVAKPWPSHSKKGAIQRKQSTNKILSTFAIVGVILFFATIFLGDLIMQITIASFQISGWILPNVLGSTMLAFVIGSVHSWIFRNNMKETTRKNFIFAATIGGLVGGIVGGILTEIGVFSNSMIIGAVIGGVAGAVSSASQGPFLQNQDLRSKWFNYSTASWLIAWVIGGTVNPHAKSTLGIAAAAMLVIISNGGLTAWFLNTHPEIEF
jgi:serine/threonine protein kinase